MIARVFACLILSIAALSPAVAQTVPADANPKPVKEKKICRGDRNSSSRIAPKICKTQAQWDASAQTEADRANEAAQRALLQSRAM